MKKIFITTPWFYPAYKAGGPVQSILNMVNALDEGYEFYIFTGDRDLDGEQPGGIKTGQWVQFNAYTKVWYAPKEGRSNTLLLLTKEVAPQLLYMVGLYDWHFTLVPLFFIKGIEKLISVRGMLHPGALAEKQLKKKVFLHLMKLIGLQKRAAMHSTDALESEHIRKQLGAAVQLYEAANFPRFIGSLTLPAKHAGQLKLVSIALISPMKNILLVLEALKGCTEELQYDIFGPVKDAAYWDQCLQVMEHLPANITVQYHKEVSPYFVPQALQKGQVFILPSKSENFGHAIYEALSAGLPVITSGFTPWNGLEAQQAGINISNTVAGVREAIQQFAAMDEHEFDAWNKGAIALADKSTNPELLKAQYKAMFTGSPGTDEKL